MISVANCFQIFSKGIVLFILLFNLNEIYAAEGGPCKDYGECDKFQYSLNAKDLLYKKFSSVDITFTPLNLPPAFVYHCSF